MDRFRPTPLQPERLRTPERPFGWVPFRLLRGGWLGQLSAGSQLLYFFLCLVADRQGLSYWGDPRLAQVLGLGEAEVARARAALGAHDLVAYADGLYQVLSLPASPAVSVGRPPAR
jgi:hypothetical protein